MHTGMYSTCIHARHDATASGLVGLHALLQSRMYSHSTMYVHVVGTFHWGLKITLGFGSLENRPLYSQTM
jgi:hypothetical protein